MAEEIKGLTIEFSADTSKFNKDMRNFNKSLSATKKESKALAESLQFEWDEKKFVKAQQLAKKAIEDTEYKAQALRDRLKQMEESGVNTDKQVVEYQKLQSQLTKTETDVQKLKEELEKINNIKIDKIKKQFEDFGQSISQVGQMMLPISAAAGGVVAGITGATLKTVEYADEIATLATQLGISNEQMQRFQYIAMQTDVSNERLTKGFTKLRTAVGQSLMGTSNMATKALEELGFTIDNLQGKSDEQIFQEVIAALGQVENSSEQAALMSQIFGERVANDLIPLVKAGANTIAELNAEFDAMGYLSEEQINNLAEFDNVLNRIRTAFGNIIKQIGVSFLPVFEKIAEYIEGKIIPAVQKITTWFTNLSDKTKGLILGIGSLLTALAPALLVGGKLISGIGNLIPLITKLGGVLKFLTGPVGIILGVLTLLYSTNEKFRETINNLISTLMSALAPILSQISVIFNELMAAIQPVITMLGDTLADVLNMLMPILNQLLAILMPIVNMIFKNIINQIKQMSSFTKVLMSILKPLITLLNDVLSVILETVIMPILSGIMSLISGVTNLIKPLIDWVGKLTDKFKNLVMKALKPVKDALSYIWDIIKSILGIKDKDIDLKVNYKTDDITLPQTSNQTPPTTQQTLQDTLGNSYLTTSNYTDNSTRNITVNLTIENYAAELDLDNIAEQINRKLVEQF